MEYSEFLKNKLQLGGEHGFEMTYAPAAAFPFQRHLIEFATRRGRSAIFADCGLGKTLMQLTWAQNVVNHTGGRVLILTPLAVSHQTVIEAEKFNIEATRSDAGELTSDIIITNYQRLHHFNTTDFQGVVCDESSILKNFDGATRSAITEFMRTRPYRLLCTATAAPNDYIELGSSSEALGELGYMDMLNRFFKKTGTTTSRKDELKHGMYSFRGHAERDFWRWVCSWSRAIRKPSDLGFDDEKFKLPELILRQHTVKAKKPLPEYLFTLPARGLAEQRQERSRTLNERCGMAAEIVNAHNRPAVVWCHLIAEGNLLEKLIPDAVQVSGKDTDAAKEERFRAFETGKIRVIVTKPTIAGFGLNWQHCAHMTFFPSHSFEQWYQCVRRCWRFGQKNDVTVDVITSEGENSVLKNMQRKAEAADCMFDQLLSKMYHELKIQSVNNHTLKEEIPAWL